ncbi:MAG TPA: cupin domain-containing protein [Solirubrobacteraceae bacterium]|nr:cupin domain-containing protein [Solirubrobacteraceae bacterium]
MARVLPLDELRRSPTAALFEGERHGGGVPVSMFITRYPQRGQGPTLHTHPYAEVFVVEQGEAIFRSGEEELRVAAGHVVVVDPDTPHGFRNAGDGELRVVSAHPSAAVVQTDLE